MPYATKAQIERARQPDLLTFLRQYKPDELIPTGPGTYKLRSHDSLKISNGKWCWWSHDKMGGVNALEYLIKVENMKFPDAVQLVNEQCGFFDAREVQSAPVKQKETPKAEFLLPVRFQNNKRVTAYLLSRGIDMAVLDYRQMEKAYKEGKVRAIGLSNFKKEQIEEILSLCEVKPTILQTELHPYHQEPELKAFLKENGIVPQAWYPLGHGDKALLEEPLFAQLGKKYGKSAPQVILRWHIQSGNIVIPGSKNPEHIKSNFDLFDFALTDDEMAQVTALNKNVRYYTNTPELLKKYAEMVPPVDEQK